MRQRPVAPGGGIQLHCVCLRRSGKLGSCQRWRKGRPSKTGWASLENDKSGIGGRSSEICVTLENNEGKASPIRDHHGWLTFTPALSFSAANSSTHCSEGLSWGDPKAMPSHCQPAHLPSWASSLSMSRSDGWEDCKRHMIWGLRDFVLGQFPTFLGKMTKPYFLHFATS